MRANDNATSNKGNYYCISVFLSEKYNKDK